MKPTHRAVWAQLRNRPTDDSPDLVVDIEKEGTEQVEVSHTKTDGIGARSAKKV